MTDEEGGGVQRMENLVGNLPWAKDMGRLWTPTRSGQTSPQ
jgi:beta-N-acetylhexosaminidase